MFDFVFDRRMPINDPMVFNLRLHASLSTKVRKCIFPLMDLNKMSSSGGSPNSILIKKFDASCFNEHKLRQKHEH